MSVGVLHQELGAQRAELGQLAVLVDLGLDDHQLLLARAEPHGPHDLVQVKRLVKELFHPVVAELMEVFPPHVDPDHQVEGGLDIHVPLSGRGLYVLPGLLVHQGRLAH